jgi:solute carrier family 25 phosphate transporter 3
LEGKASYVREKAILTVSQVMVSKLNANRQQGEAFGAAMGRIYKDIGFRGLWNGLPVRIVMIGTLTGLQWMIYVRKSS